jgi:beta-phosphoglucomutase family hydrolase
MPPEHQTVHITPERFDAVLFDLDGVLTRTADVHAAAWEKAFDWILGRVGAERGVGLAPFDRRSDFQEYVDGLPRLDGVRAFLDARGVTLPEGSPTDPVDAETVWGVGNRKNAMLQEILRTDGVRPYDDGVALLRGVRAAGVRTAVVSSSRNCLAVITATGLVDDFDVRVDGTTVDDLHLAGKPAPDTYLYAASFLGVAPARAVVVEDALAGVRSGRAGGFGLVVGVDRTGDPEALRENGADVVTADLRELLPAAP